MQAMNARAAKRLYDGKKAAARLTEYVAGKTLEKFLGGDMLRYAVERQAGVLASAMAASVREAPELEGRLHQWERIVALDECLALDAGQEELVRLWNTVVDDVPPLLAAIEHELEAFGPPPAEALPNSQGRVVELITEHLAEIGTLCQQYKVARLDVFGSAATGAFTESSDIDFLVTWKPESKRSISRYLELESALQELLGREIDLIDDKEFENPYFRYSVRVSRVALFEDGRVGAQTERDPSRCSG
jgi:predicted nucleotidyltransferase/uncharacterized protein with HEPN domain